MPKVKEIFFSSNSPALFIPMIVLIGMLIAGYTPTMAAVWAVVISLVFFFAKAILTKNIIVAAKQFFEACVEGGRTITMIAVILGTAQVIATVISMTGLGTKISNLIVGVGSSAIIVTLILGMIVTIILGMGVPTVAAYMLSASVIYPAFAALGFPVLASHLFILYYAILSGITPPVALAAYVGASISGSHWFKTSIAACKIGLSGFLIPYMFLFNPALLGQGEWHVVTLAVITAVLGIIALAGSTIGYLFTHAGWMERVVFLAVALLLIQPGVMTDTVGLALFILTVGYQYVKMKKNSSVKLDTEKGLA